MADAARRLGLPLSQPPRVNEPGAVAEIGAAARSNDSPPVVVVCAFGALIAEPLLSAQETLNVHPSLLPRWRGAAPVERAIMAGDERTGVSIMRLTAGLDEGPVCLAEAEPIAPDDTYGTLAVRLEELGAELLLRALDEHPPFVEQHGEATYAEKITAADRMLDAAYSAVELERRVRALHPHIGARLPGGLGVHRAALAPQRELAPGALASDAGRLFYGATPGTLELLRVRPPGGREMDAAAYLRGHAV